VRRRRIVLAVLCLLTAMGAGSQHWERPRAVPDGGYVLTVEAGDSLRDVAARLQGAGILSAPALLRLYGRLTGMDQRVQQGDYLLSEHITAAALLRRLHSGKVMEYAVTIPEGITLAQALSAVQRESALERLLSAPDDARILDLVRPHGHPEGLFFPDTYHYRRGDTDLDILARANAAMRAILQEEWASRAQDLPYDNPYQALIMASIIERETGLPAERQRIAGVFVRRLQRGMRLQTDPTVIYGLGAAFDGNLRRAHLRDDTNVYNTYRHGGLPPTPIALPGRAAIHAALHPAPGSALYFVARGDGGHVFSDSLAEHERAVRQYQLQRRENYRSAPGGEL